MKKFIPVLLVLAIAGCSTNKSAKIDSPKVTAIGNQKLETNFKRQGIKIEWDCSWTSKITDSNCEKGDIKTIEVTAYATSNGNSENNREDAFRVAELRAKAKLRHFIAEEVRSTQTINTLSKNLEKANDRIKNRIANSEQVSMSDDEASKDTNWAIRENNNNIARTVVENIQKNAQGILRGVYVIDESVVDRQTVSSTIRWDQNSFRASESIRNKFGN
jgi:hypothetical protein